MSITSETKLPELVDQIAEEYGYRSGRHNFASATNTTLQMNSMLEKVKQLASNAGVENTSVINADYMVPAGHATLKNYRYFRSESELKVILSILTNRAASLWAYPDGSNWIISIDANTFDYVQAAPQIAPDAPVFEGEQFLNLSFQVSHHQAVKILKAFAAL